MGKHLAPRHLLQGFACRPNGKTVLQMDRKNKPLQPHEVAIEKASQSRKAFSDDVEFLMSSIERKAAAIIEHLRTVDNRSGSVFDASSKRLLSIYMAMFLWRRNRDFVFGSKQSSFSIDEAEILTEQVAADWGPKIQEYVLLSKRKFANDFVRGQEESLRNSWVANNVTRFWLSQMTWRLLCSGDEDFWLPENVLFMAGRGKAGRPVELCLPISCKRALHLSWQGASTRRIRCMELSGSMVRLLNRWGAQTSRFVFFRKKPSYAMNKMLTRHKTKRHKRIDVSEGENPFIRNLTNFDKWVNADFRGATNTICLAPEAPFSNVADGVQVSVHEWEPHPIRKRIAIDAEHTMATIWACKHCGHNKIKYDDGNKIAYRDMEVELANKTATVTSIDGSAMNVIGINWWDRLKIGIDE